MPTEKCKKCGADLSFIEQGYEFCDKCFCKLNDAEQKQNSIRMIPDIPTEKDIQYYEELVRQEVADKTLSPGVIIEYYDSDPAISMGTYTGVITQIVDCGHGWYQTNLSPESIYIYKILGHEVMIGDMIEWMFENIKWIDMVTDYNRIDVRLIQMLSLRYNKRLPYSYLPDDTKIELGKIVEEVLSSKKE